MARNNVLLYGDRHFKPTKEMAARVAQVLNGLSPSCVITDFSPGWNQFVLSLALDNGIPVVGAAPFPRDFRDTVKTRLTSSILFNQTLDDFLTNPQTYYDWLAENVDSVLAHYSPDTHRPMLKLHQRVKLYNLGGR